MSEPNHGDVAHEVRETLDEVREGAAEAHETVERIERLRHAPDAIAAVNPAAGLAATATDLGGRIAGSEATRAVAAGIGAAGALFEAGRALAGLVRDATAAGAAPLPEAGFSFEHAGEDRWEVESFEAAEALSTVTVTTVTAVCETAGAEAEALLGRDAALAIARLGSVHRLQGVVSRVERLGWRDGKTRARFTVVPALWALSQRRDSRIFEAKTVREIIDAVVNPSLGAYQRETRWSLQREPGRREHTVQYQETDLAFIERLLAEEGISYAFVPGERHETLVFFDHPAAQPRYVGPAGEALLVADEDHSLHARETLRRFEASRTLVPTRVAVRDFDWTRPAATVGAEQVVADDPAGRARTVYLHPAEVERSAYDNGTHAYTQHDATLRATLAAQRLAQPARTFTGEGNVTGLHPGLRVRVEGHREAALDRGYLVRWVCHRGSAPETSRHAEIPLPQRYVCEAHFVLDDAPLRPALATGRARVNGPQTATVVTTSEDDAQSEHHGRVRVQFHWEREGAPEAAQRAWVRVAQAWAGADFGAQFVPRKGMEVVVHFLEGDPDRPLVTGAVYNGTHPLPFPIEEHATRSGFRTRSTDGQGGELAGFNELSFEDRAGGEEVYVHAQRNLRERVRHDHTTSVGHDHTNTVGRDDRETVDRDQDLRVKHDRKVRVDHDQRVVIGNDLATRIDHHEERLVGSGGRTTTVHYLDQRDVRGADVQSVTESQNIEVHGSADHTYRGHHFRLVHEGDSGTTLRFDRDHAKWQSQKSVYVDNPVGTLKLEGSRTAGAVTLESKLDEVVIRCASAVIRVKKDGSISLEGSKEISLHSGGSKAVLARDGRVSVEGTGEVSIKGSKIKLNA